MKPILLAIALCLLPSLASAQALETDGWPTHLAIGAFLTLNGADLATTAYLLGSARGREANALLAPLSTKPVAFGLVKMGIATSAGYLMLRLHAQHPKLAFTVAALGSVFYAGVVVHNASLLPKENR